MPPPDSEFSFDLSRVLVDFLPDGLLVVDEQGAIVHVNERLADMFGYDRGELIGQAIEVLVPEPLRGPHTAHRTRFRVDPAVRTMGVGRTLKGRRRDGTELAVEVGLSPMHTEAGLRVVAIVRDVSEQVALRAQADLVQQTIEATHDGVFMFDADSLGFTYVNSGAASQTGYSQAELLGMTPLHIKPLFSEPEFRALLKPLLNDSQRSVEFETIHRRKDGSDLPVGIVLEYPQLEDASLRRPLVAIVRDISERKEAEGRLRASEAAFRQAFDDAPVAMAAVELDAQGGRRIREANKAFEELFGFSVADRPDLSFADLGLEENEAEARAIARAMASGQQATYRAERQYRRADGSPVWAQVHSATLDSTEGEVTTLAHIIDISDRKAAERARDHFEQQIAMISRLRLGLLGDEPMAASLKRLCADARASTLASGAVIVEHDDATGRLVAWGSASSDDLDLPGGSSLSPLLTTDADAAPLVVSASAADVRADDIVLLELLGAETLVAGAIGDHRAVALLCAEGDRGHDLATLERLVVEVGEAVALAEARADRSRMGLLEDRERIATDLHDVVIQRLFAAGMRLQASLPMLEPSVRDKVQAVVSELDTTIAEIRDTIFALHQYDTVAAPLSERLSEVIQANRVHAGLEPSIEIDASIDEVRGPVAEHLVPVVTEMLSNVARHARASSVDVLVAVGDDTLTVRVVDDGAGIDVSAPRGHGLDNLARRARDVGGGFSVAARDSGGTEAVWWAPAPA